MFLPLALMVQIMQISGELNSQCHHIDRRNYDYGNDYLAWISVSSLSQCRRECESTVDPNADSLSSGDLDVCHGFTWVKNGNRNCALYNARGVESGVYRRGQDSYQCYFALPAGADELNSGSGYSTFNPGTKMFDDNLAIIIEKKHFCPACSSPVDAAAFSIERNRYCRANGCQVAGTNTVFVASFPAQQGNWYVTEGGKIYSQGSFDTYNCRNVPLNPTNEDPPPTCVRKTFQCYAGPFNRNNGHLIWEKVEQWCW